MISRADTLAGDRVQDLRDLGAHGNFEMVKTTDALRSIGDSRDIARHAPQGTYPD